MSFSLGNQLRTKTVAWIAIAALLFQIFVPLLHYGLYKNSEGSGGSLRLCRAFDQTSDQGSTKNEKQDKHHPSCPLCQALHLLSGALTPFSTPALFYVFALVLVLSFFLESFRSKEDRIVEGRPRGPPAHLA